MYIKPTKKIDIYQAVPAPESRLCRPQREGRRNNGLAGVTAVPVMTGGWPGHLLAVEVHLRPVLVELGATVPSRGLYVTEPEFADLTSALAKWSASAIPLIRGTLGG